MRSPTPLLTLLVLALLAVSATAWFPINKSDRMICKRKSKDAYEAITAFCNKSPYKVPSTNARIGRYSKNAKIYANITGKCKPQQQVPKEWCFKQFYNMCRNGRKNGSNINHYGGGGCQFWTIAEKGYFIPSGPK